jgi:hypothetical protein
MIIQIESYFGHDVLTLIFNEKDTQVSDATLLEIDEISNKFGYNLADQDVNEDGAEYVRVQEINVDNSEKVAKTELLNLVGELTKKYL